MENKNKFKFKAYAILAKSQVWEKHLKPDLENIKREVALSESDLNNIEEHATRDIKRTTTIKIINRIISIVERAENKIK